MLALGVNLLVGSRLQIVGYGVIIECLLADAGTDGCHLVLLADIADIRSCIVFLQDNVALHFGHAVFG